MDANYILALSIKKSRTLYHKLVLEHPLTVNWTFQWNERLMTDQMATEVQIKNTMKRQANASTISQTYSHTSYARETQAFQTANFYPRNGFSKP